MLSYERALMGAGGLKEVIPVEDVFSTWVYTGTGSAQTITNGIDLAGKGGMVWVKARNTTTGHRLMPTVGQTFDSSVAGDPVTNEINSYNSNGFTLGSGANTNVNGNTYSSWTFRKQEKFFDVLTYYGNGSVKTINHSLGAVPGVIIVKRDSGSNGGWVVYQGQSDYYSELHTTGARVYDTTMWNNTSPTATAFTVGAAGRVNANGWQYTAYLFANDTGPDGLIRTGTYQGNASVNGPVIDLGWEAQFVLIKCLVGGDWNIFDNMRGAELNPNLTLAESAGTFVMFTATGFRIVTTDLSYNRSDPISYIAIRRGPMKTPTDATKVFQASTYSGTGTANRSIPTNFPVDFALWTSRNGVGYNGTKAHTRLLNPKQTLQLDSTAAESSTWDTAAYQAFNNDNVVIDAQTTGYNSSFIPQALQWLFRRAPGFFDVVAYTGVSPGQSNNHNLGVTPDLIIGKARTSGGYNDWYVWSPTGAGIPANTFLVLNSTAARNTFGTPSNWTATSTTFKSEDSFSGVNYIAYLFASCPGVSKVGSYTGTGTTLNVDCGFTSGARFVLIKRTDSTGDWYVWDTARGIVSGNDPYTLLNSTAPEVTSTDYIDPLSSGFQISSSAPAAINANGGSYIYFSVA